MTNVPTNRFAQIPLPLDGKICNYHIITEVIKAEGIEENVETFIVVESIEEYLSRIEVEYRTVGIIITILLPKVDYTGTNIYVINSFEEALINYDITYYTFKDGTQDINFVELKFNYNPRTNINWHTTGVIFYSSTDNDTDVVYTSGSICIHDWTVLSDAEIALLGRSNYHPERFWPVSGTTLTLDDSSLLYIFAKVPKDIDNTTAEIIITSTYNYEDLYEDFVYIIMGSITQNVNDLRVFSMIQGNDAYFPKKPVLTETQLVFVSQICEFNTVYRTGTLLKTYKIQSRIKGSSYPWIDTGETKVIPEYDITSCPLPTTDTVIISEGCQFNGDYNTGIYEYNKQDRIQDINGEWHNIGMAYTETQTDLVACPLPETDTIVISEGCVEGIDGYNTGNYQVIKQNRIKNNSGVWINNGPQYSVITYNTVTCPLTLYRLSMSVGPGPSYNMLKEEDIRYRINEIIYLSSPILGGTNYFFISIPSNKVLDSDIETSDVILRDVGGIPINSEFSFIGYDNRIGFRNNSVYRKANTYCTNYAAYFSLFIKG